MAPLAHATSTSVELSPVPGTRVLKALLGILTPLVLLGLITACHRQTPPTPLARILIRGELTVIVNQNPDGFYWSASDHDGGQPSGGFEYELVHLLARDLGVGLRIRPMAGGKQMLEALLAGEGDIIYGADFPPALGQDRVIFTRPFFKPRVQAILAPGRSVSKGSSPQALAYHAHRRDIYSDPHNKLNSSLVTGDIVAHPELSIDGLFREVAAGRFPTALVDAPLVNRLVWDYPQVRQGSAWAAKRELAWALPPHGEGLKTRIDTFISRLEAEGHMARLVARYFPAAAKDPELGISAFHKRIPVRLPAYLDTICQAAARYGFDWELIAALTYQESLWNPGAVSTAGARGLMQLLPDTAKSLGVSDIHNPRENIWAGVRYLNAYFDFYNRAPTEDRLKIALAAYNVGIGHILDARNLARERGRDPNRWASLMETLPLLSLPEYYRRSQYGYCRGKEPVQYVDSVMIYAGILKRRVLSIKDDLIVPGTVGPAVPESPPFRAGR